MTDKAESYGLGVVASDLNNDGRVHVFVANDSNPNFLYRNDGHGKFTEVGTWSGAGLDATGKAQAGMGVDVGDLDGRGLQDILLTTFASDHATIYHNEGNLFFSDISAQRGLRDLTYVPVKWGCAFFDFDNDGALDILIVNGHIYPQVDSDPKLHEHYRLAPTLLHNQGGRFTDVTSAAGPGMNMAISGRGLAVGDINNDGYLDLSDYRHRLAADTAAQRHATQKPLAQSAIAESSRQPRDQCPGSNHRWRQNSNAGSSERLNLPLAELVRFALRDRLRHRNRHSGSRLARRAANRSPSRDCGPTPHAPRRQAVNRKHSSPRPSV